MPPKRMGTRSRRDVAPWVAEPRGRSVLAITTLALFVLGIAVVGGGGCTTIPAPVVSPVAYRQKASFTGLTSSVAMGWARARIRRPDGVSQVITGNGEHSWGMADREGTLLGMLMPALVSMHFAGPRVDGGAHLGWRGLGALARTPLLTTEGDATTALVFGARIGWFKELEVSSSLEQSVVLSPGARLLLRLGLAGGYRRYDVEVPDDLDPTAGLDNSIGAAHLDLHRVDARLTALVGIDFGSRLILSLQPYRVIAHGQAYNVRCVSCVPDVQLIDFTLDSGLSLAVTLRVP
jgi:hypothetical protein